ncbi:MAG: Spy/CpxP family protein refolding chaperone [Candidatus Gastranaerophilaceae bacterium]
MKKSFFLASMLAIALIAPNTASFAHYTPPLDMHKCPPYAKEMPKLYDKKGNELKNPPKPGDKVYDRNGKQIQRKAPSHRMKKKFKGPELNLSDVQKNKADKIREESKQKIKPIIRESHNLQNQIWKIEDNDNLTKEQKHEQIKPLIEQFHKLHQQANAIRQEDMKKFESILSESQKKALEKFKKEHKSFRKHGRSMPPKGRH